MKKKTRGETKMISAHIDVELLQKFEQIKAQTGMTSLTGFINFLMYQYFKNAGL